MEIVLNFELSKEKLLAGFQHEQARIDIADSMFSRVRMERRQKPRVTDPFPATVMGVGLNGRAFEAESLVENLSSSGLFLRLSERVEHGARLTVAIRMARRVIEANHMRLVTHGEIVRTEIDSSGLCGVAVKFTSRRLL